ncbi:MAG TPA: glutathione peroxidase, partial [Flavobacteriaceae bacterium]|nr:glutathione peroxidase [Flavobacteriaceae bacterium]
MEASLFELEAKKLNGETISLKEFEGKTIVVVNTASKCGLTPQYEG